MISLFPLKGNVQEYVTVCKKNYLKKWNVSAVGSFTVTAALRVTLRDITETYVAVAWDRAVPDNHAS